MHSGTIQWNGSDLALLGKPKLGIRRQADPPAPAHATRSLVSLTVSVELEALDSGTVQARAEFLAASMQVAEGILELSSGSGHVLSWLATPGDNNLAEVLGGRTNTVEMNFAAVENHGTAALAALTSASFTPAGSDTPLALHAIRDLKEEVRTARHSERASARSATTTTLSFTARVAMSNPAESLSSRLSYLQGQAEAVKQLDAREGVLVLGSMNRIVRVTDFSPVMDERRGALDVTVQCYTITLPDSGTAECSWELETRTEAGSGEDVLSLKGTIEAESRSLALAKLETIRTAQAAVTGQRVAAYATTDKIIDGFDTSGVEDGDWGGALGFTLEVRRARSGGHHTLRITTSKDIRGGCRWNYSGSVLTSSEADALATARAIAAGASHPIQTRGEETLERVSEIDGGADMQFVKLDFSYEFEGPSDGFISGEITTETNRPISGEWRRSIIGYLIADSTATAETRLALLLASAGTQLEVTRRTTEVYLDASGSDTTPKRVATRLDFTCAVRDARNFAAVEFNDTTENDFSTMRQNREVSGTLWSDTEAHAEVALSTLATVLFGAGGAQRTRRSHSKLQWSAPGALTTTASSGGGSQWVKLEFSLGCTTRITGTTGYDLLEASFSMERTGSLSGVVITPIPFGRPVAQVNTGYLPGRITLTASAKAVTQATAKQWVQERRGYVTNIGSAGVTRHETDPPRETCAPEYAPFDGSTPTLWSFAGAYGWTFTGNVLDGIWGSSGLPS